MTKKRLTPQQLQAIEYFKQPNNGGLTYDEIGEKVGVSRQTLHAWMNKDHFYDELKKQIVKNTAKRLPEVLESIPEQIIKSGNAAMLRTYLQMHGMLQENHVIENKGGNVDTASDVESLKQDIERFKKLNKDNE